MIPAAAIAVPGRLRTASHDRTGVTLIELLVSLVIVSILATISMAGLSTARLSARKAKTQATIRKISEIILPYYEEYETRRPTIGNVAAIAAAGGRESLSKAKQTAIRRLMTLELPERATDYRDALTLPNGSFGVRPLLIPISSTVSGTLSEIPPSARRYYSLTNALMASGSLPSSSELLHLIVTRGPVADPDIIAHFREDEVRDTDGNGLPEFVDGWNRPIAFRRWPIGFASPMQPILGSIRDIDPLVSNNGHRLVPLIFSAGLDGSYDIDSMDSMASLSYFALNYNPFPSSPSASAIAVAPQTPAVAGSVVLEAITPPSGSVAAPTVFKATRLAANATIPAGAFQTVGSERDTGSADSDNPNGVVESRDNIHNHDMTR